LGDNVSTYRRDELFASEDVEGGSLVYRMIKQLTNELWKRDVPKPFFYSNSSLTLKASPAVQDQPDCNGAR